MYLYIHICSYVYTYIYVYICIYIGLAGKAKKGWKGEASGQETEAANVRMGAAGDIDHCNTPQHTAAHCNTWQTRQLTATYCNTLQHTSNFRMGATGVLQFVEECCSVLLLKSVAVCCSVWQCVVVCCSVLQCVAVWRSAWQCVAV